MVEVLLVMVGGAVGSVTRYGASLWALQAWGTGFPFGTLLINIVGSFILGFLVSLSGSLTLSIELRLLLGTGFCGGFTTFSTFSIDTLNLLEKGEFIPAMGYLFGNLGGGLLAAALGFALGRFW